MAQTQLSGLASGMDAQAIETPEPCKAAERAPAAQQVDFAARLGLNR